MAGAGRMGSNCWSSGTDGGAGANVGLMREFSMSERTRRESRGCRRAYLGLLAAVLTIGAGFGGVGGQVSPEPGRIECQVVSVESASKHDQASLIVVKVSNRGRTAFEPIAFEITTKKGERRVVFRAPEPWVRREGRPVAAGASHTYPVFVVLPKAELLGAGVRMIEAAGGDPKVVPVPCELGSARTEKRRHESGSTIEIAVLPIKNRAERVVDVILKLRLDRPSAETILVHRRLPARGELVLTFSDSNYEPTPEGVEEGQASTVEVAAPRGARIQKAEIVDWCTVIPSDEEAQDAAAEQLFASAYVPWVRWEAAEGFAARLRGEFQAPGGASAAFEGSFAVSKDGVIGSVEGNWLSVVPRTKIDQLLSTAFDDLRRPSFEVARAKSAPVLLRQGPISVLGLQGSAWSDTYRKQRIAVSNSRFVGHNWYGSEERSMRCEWTPEPFEGGYVVAARRHFNATGSKAPDLVEHWRYQRIDGTVWPIRVVVDEYPTNQSLHTRMVANFADYRLAEVKVGPVPSPEAERLRAAWDRGRRAGPMRANLTCRFVAKPGKDGVWQGVREVRGVLDLEGFDGVQFEGVTAKVEGVPDSVLADSLGRIVIDRLPMWCGRDFAGRGDFDRVFASATITSVEGDPEQFLVSAGPYQRIRIGAGLVQSVEFRGGGPRSFTWSELEGQPLVSEVVTGGERVSATFVKLGELVLPTNLIFRGVFGDEKEWGNEELRLLEWRKR